MKTRILLTTLVILTMGLACAPYVGAQDDPESAPPPQQAPTPAPTAVGRISVLRGNVSTMHGDAGEWVAATVNTPVVPGDKVATADRSRVEVQLDFANLMRLEERTEAKVADLEQNKIDIQLASGTVNFTVFNGTQADAEVDTPNMGVHPLAPGVYRIQVNSPSETLLIVRQGEAEVLTNQGSTKVQAGQTIQIHGTDNPEYKIDPAPGVDDFDKWCSDRDRQIQSAQASPHADHTYLGSSDLDVYGQWSEVPNEGWCWTPRVDAGWVPYTYGSWGWEPYWGWTWISYEPWGWAPYHSGFWFSYGGHWHWRPDHDGDHGHGGWGGSNGHGGWGGAGGHSSGNHWGSPNGNHFLPRGGGVVGRPNANVPSFGPHTGFAAHAGSMAPTGRTGAGGSAYNWQGFRRGNQSGQRPSTFNAPSTGWQGRSTPASQSNQYNWRRYASPSPYSGVRTGSGQSIQRGGWQGYSSAPRNYSGGASGWNAPAPRSGGPYYGGGSRPPLQLNRPIMRERAPSGGYYGGGGRNYSAPSGGGRTYSAPSGGGNHNYSAPHSSGGGGGGSHNSGGGGGRHR